jgi:hypothetical protein
MHAAQHLRRTEAGRARRRRIERHLVDCERLQALPYPRQYEAKALGIAMGAPWHLLRKQFEAAGVIVRPSNYTLYGL